MARACWPVHVLRATPDDVFIASPPLAFTVGLGGLLLFPLSFGASSVLLERPSPDLLLPAITRHRATVCFTAPTFFRMMAPIVGRYDLASLTKCVSAGEALPDATRQLFKQASGIEILDGLGSTEMIHIFISHAPDRVRRGAFRKRRAKAASRARLRGVVRGEAKGDIGSVAPPSSAVSSRRR